MLVLRLCYVYETTILPAAFEAWNAVTVAIEHYVKKQQNILKMSRTE